MKYKLTKEEFDALEETIKGEYSLDGDSATLKIEGDDAPTPELIAQLKKKKEIAEEHQKNANSKLKESEDRAAKLQKDLESAGGDKAAVEKLRVAHAAELEKMRAERAEETKRVIEERNSSMIKEEASKFAAANFVDAPYGSKFIAEAIAKRMNVEEVGGQPVIRVIGEDGLPSTASLSDLQKEFLDNSEFSPIVLGKAGSGGGASQTSHKSGGVASKKSLKEMTATEEAAFERDNPEAYAAAMGQN